MMEMIKQNNQNSTDKKRRSFAILGAQLDVGNRGCRALASSCIRIILRRYPDARIYLLYANRTGGTIPLKVDNVEHPIEIVNCRFSPRSRPGEQILWILFLAILQKIVFIPSLRRRIIRSNRFLRTLWECDVVGEIRGGDSFSDIYGFRWLVFGLFPTLACILLRKDLVMLPQTYGPFKARASRFVARRILHHSHLIYSRDRESMNLIETLRTRKDSLVKFCPDMAFVLESQKPPVEDIQPPLPRPRTIPMVGVNISGLLYVGGFNHNNMFNLKVEYKDFIVELLTWILEQFDVLILLVPHVMCEGDEDVDELRLCRQVREDMEARRRDRIHVVNQYYNEREIKSVIGQCDFFIGSRMHACIAALSQGIPAVGLAYSKKFRGVFDSIDMADYVINMYEADTETVFRRIREGFERRAELSEHLRLRIPQIQTQVHDQLKEAICGV